MGEAKNPAIDCTPRINASPHPSSSLRSKERAAFPATFPSRGRKRIAGGTCPLDRTQTATQLSCFAKVRQFEAVAHWEALTALLPRP